MAPNKNPKTASEECPRWDFCSCNDCPLAPGQYETFPEDPQTTCDVAKSIRVRIGTKWKLSNKGMKPRELAAQKIWDALPESVRKERIAKLKKNSPIVRLSQKGYKIAPKSENKSQTHGQNPLNHRKTPYEEDSEP